MFISSDFGNVITVIFVNYVLLFKPEFFDTTFSVVASFSALLLNIILLFAVWSFLDCGLAGLIGIKIGFVIIKNQYFCL